MNKIFKERIDKLNKYVKEKKCDAILLNKNSDVFYLTGFYDKENIAYLVINDNQNIFITDGRFINQFHNSVKDFKLEIFSNKNNKFQEIRKILLNNNSEKILFNYSEITYKDVLNLDIDKSKMFDCTGIMQTFRSQKDKEEIKNIRKSCAIAEQSFLEIIKKIKVGQTEKEIQRMLDEEMLNKGSQENAFPTIVASGENNGASPHAVPTDRKIKEGDLITIDFGATYNRYRSDITRTIAVGNIDEKKREIYYKTLEAKENSVKQLQAGKSASKIHNIANDVINEYGYEFLHGLGHGIGIDIHETPFINASNNKLLKENEVHTIEPGIYIPGIGGVRIEDDYLITKEGSECLTPNITTDLITI